jgi:hypothetical protein
LAFAKASRLFHYSSCFSVTNKQHKYHETRQFTPAVVAQRRQRSGRQRRHTTSASVFIKQQ